jgi:hypothetical protein
MNETLRQYGVALFGGTPTELRDSYTRCPARQLRAYEARMREAGRSIHVEWFDAGHGGLTPDQRIAFHEQALQFAGDILSD